MRSRPCRRHAFASVLGSALAALQGGAACAPHLTCPWTQVSDVTVEPATACLSVSVAPFDDNPLDDPGGCADPSLVVANDCAEALTISDMNVTVKLDSKIKRKLKFEDTFSLRGHTGPIRALVLSSNPGNPILASTGDDGTVRVWRAPRELKE